MLTIKDLSFKTDDKEIIKNIKYDFQPGKIYAILGNNGVGKSTLVKIIMGMNGYFKNHGGSIYFDNEDITELSLVERAQIGITITNQEPARFKGISVEKYLKLGGKNNYSDEKIIDALRTVGLNGIYRFRKVDKTLSGGERKRIELASILLLKPRVVIFDEPDSGIDMMSNSMLADVIKKLKESDSTVIIITHREEISLLADEALLLCNGYIRDVGNPVRINKLYKETCDVCGHVNRPVGEEVMK